MKQILLLVTLLMPPPFSFGADNAPVTCQFVFISPFVDYDFFKPIQRGMNDAAKAMGVACRFTGTKDGDVKALAGMVRQAVKDGADGIALNIIDPVALDQAVAEATAKGVPVVAFNVDDHRTPNARLAAVCQNFHEAGRTLGREAAAFVPDGAKILMTMHDAGVSALEDRLRGAQEVLKPRGVTWTQVITGTERNQAVEKIHAALAADPAIRVVLATGQADTEAAGLAIAKYFAGKGYAAAGFDLSPDTLRLVQAEVIRFTIDQQPYVQGFYPVVALTLYKRYGLKPSNFDAGAAIITKENVDSVVRLNARQIR
jgi:simple sugar transport system substrate-binding protein